MAFRQDILALSLPHDGKSLLLFGRILRDVFKHITQQPCIVVADRADVLATAATGHNSGTPQYALPQIERGFGTDKFKFSLRIFLIKD